MVSIVPRYGPALLQPVEKEVSEPWWSLVHLDLECGEYEKKCRLQDRLLGVFSKAGPWSQAHLRLLPLLLNFVPTRLLGRRRRGFLRRRSTSLQ